MLSAFLEGYGHEGKTNVPGYGGDKRQQRRAAAFGRGLADGFTRRRACGSTYQRIAAQRDGVLRISSSRTGKLHAARFYGRKGALQSVGSAASAARGDFPMLMATSANDAWLSFVTTRFSVCDVIGRSIVIHAERDDYTSQPAGDSGARIGCGIIQAI